MNDGIVDGVMQRGLLLKVLGGALPVTRKAIAKHDEAMREALARVEAERDSVQIEAMSYAEQRDAAQAQLAEAVERLAKAEETIARLQSGAVT